VGQASEEESEVISVRLPASPELSFSKRQFDLPILRLCRCALTLLTALVLTAQHAAAEQFAPYDEIKRKSAVFEPQPSLDTTPVTLKVVDVTYRIPRNYLISTGEIPTLKLTWPGLKPLTEETRKCFGSILQSEQAGCTSLTFHLLGSRGPAPGGRAFTNSEMFENFMRGFDVKPKKGPFGYDVYEIGPREVGSETYRRTDGDIYFHCSYSVCSDSFRLHDMNHIQFHFRRQQIEHVVEIEAAMRQLMEQFVVR
jgi:hypothetical protein